MRLSTEPQSFAIVISFILLIHTIPLAGSVLNSDRQALLDFALAVRHGRKLNWNSSLPVCGSWVGISCDKAMTRVTAIHLPGVGLTGPIPTSSIGKLDALEVLSLRSNCLSGTLPSDLPSLASLHSVHLEHNNFSGEIPTFLSPRLSVMDLSFNSFSGSIPPTVNNLLQITVLNLQFNSFSGAIPDLNLPRLKQLNLSYNMLNGSIPHSLQKFPASSFLGNALLCGPPLTYCSVVPPSPSPSPSSSSTFLPSPLAVPSKRSSGYGKKLRTGVIIAIAVGGFSILCPLVLILLFSYSKTKHYDTSRTSRRKASEKPKEFGSGVQEAERNKLVFFEGCPYNFDLKDLLRASAEVLGKSGYGTAYKATLEEGTVVVVKRLRDVGVNKREFEQQMEIIGTVGQHPNLIPLRAYHYSKDEKLLVYDYVAGGSLSALLHGNMGTGRSPLDWNSRLRISLGTAVGIKHIHSKGGVKITHGNIKSSNVLLTKDLDGCVSDFGLPPMMNFLAASTRGPGYRAPEVIESRKVTQKSDVYSFGVLLLEMLTGKSPHTPSGHEDTVDLPRWVSSVAREEWTAAVFDAQLIRQQNVQEEMVQMLRVALACVAKAPDSRPTMDEVVRLIEEIRQTESAILGRQHV